MVVVRVAAGAFLVAHGLVHLLYLADDVPEFSMDQSWLVPGAARRPLALGLVAATIVGFLVVALAVWGLPGLSGWWPGVAVVACLLSMVLLGLYWDTWLMVGFAIDLAVLAVAVTHPDWVEPLMG
jgi:hypothetical protein